MVREKVEHIFNKLYEGMYERDEAIRLSLLTSIAGESVFLLGPPGVAKSLIARRMKYVFKDAKNFEYLMGRFSTPDEIFGPISISKLKSEDKYERITTGYLPDSEIIFLDEIWKASPAIQNTLLTAINEKIFRNGTEEMKINLKLLIAASNELPAKGEGLEALWDRFVIRLYVDGIKDKENFEKMIQNITDLYQDNIPEKDKITEEEYKQWQEEIKNVEIPPEVLEIIDVIRKKIVLRNQQGKDKEPLYISDRRWKKIANILRTSAFLNGRNSVDIMDLFLIPYSLWNVTEEIDEVNYIANDVIGKYGYKIGVSVEPIKKKIEHLKSDIEKNTKREVVIEKEVLKVYKYEIGSEKQEQFYRLKSPIGTGRYEYEDIRKSDFEQLEKNKWIRLDLYNHRTNQVNSKGHYGIKKKGEFEIDVEDEDDNFELEHEKKEEIKIEGKIPDKVKINEWDKKIGELNNELDIKILKITEYKNRDMTHAKNNLFVDIDLSSIAFMNLDRTSGEVAKMKVELEKLRGLYESER